MKVSGLMALAGLMSTASVAAAGVVIESVNKHQQRSKVSIDEQRARIDSGSPDGYMLMDLASGKSYTVNHLEGVVIDLESAVATSEHITNAVKDRMMPTVELVKQGDGPLINGYPTVHYRVTINGSIDCSDEYLSLRAVENPVIKRFVAAMAKGSDGAENIIMASLFGDQQMCEAAADIIDDEYAEKGLPMRSVDQQGMVIHEITSITTAVALTNEEMTIPAGYDLLSREQMRERIKERNKELQAEIDALPDIDMDRVMQQQREMQQRMKDSAQDLKNELKTGFE